MRRVRVGLLAGVLCGIAGQAAAAQAAAVDGELSVALEPVRYLSVNGDAGKFRAHHWTKEGYSGGLKHLSFHQAFDNGLTVESESHALIDQNDLGTELAIEKEGLGFVRFDYTEFRKYYDNNGGTYYRFPVMANLTTDQDLHLDIGKFGVETGLTLEQWPTLSFLYEREFKSGAKSRLTWAAVNDNSVTRSIGPAWQDVNEIVDTFAVKAAHESAGFTFGGEQRWEFARSEAVRVEQSRTTSGTEANGKIRYQEAAPEASVMTTTLTSQRPFWGERGFFSSGYHYTHLDNREFESLTEYNAAGALCSSCTRPEFKPNNRADNDYDAHAWVGTFSVSPLSWFTVGTKLKSELVAKESTSNYNNDFRYSNSSGVVAAGTLADGNIDATVNSLTDLRAQRWGEGLFLRTSLIPRTALYTELELEQGRVVMREDRIAIDNPAVSGNGTSNLTETFNRNTVTSIRRGNWILGTRVDPHPWFDIAADVRRRVNNNDYDDQRESTASSTELSAFTDAQDIHTNEATARVTFRPCRWFRSSLRYQYRADEYSTRFEAQDTQKADLLSHIYTYDVTLMPLKTLTTTASFSRQASAVTSPGQAMASATAYAPTFNAGVGTWLLGVDYSPKPEWTLTNHLLYSQADNFNDFASSGLPLGVDNERVDVVTAVHWAIAPDLEVGAEYAFYHFQTNDNAESGDYDAHALWFTAEKTF